MKKLEGLTLADIKEQWAKGAKYYLKDNDCYSYYDYPLSLNCFSSECAVSRNWILELPEEKPMTDEEIVHEATKMSIAHCWLDSDMKRAIKMARQSERLKYQRLKDLIYAYERLLMAIRSSPKASIGSYNNVYVPNSFDVKTIDEKYRELKQFMEAENETT